MDAALIRYRNIVMDNVRWDGFQFRDGDIIISTPAKCGTTWLQTICAFLVFGTTDLPAPVDMLSPWLDQSLRPLDEVVADLTAQNHRRFIKSHTPLDGLPWDDRVTYITVGRDPRDVALSWDNHMSNLDFNALIELRGKAVGNEDLAELMGELPPPLPELSERFWAWMGDPSTNLGGLATEVHHLRTFWDVRDKPNVILLHYGELKADLERQMRALAAKLGLDIDEAQWPSLAKAATFDEMKKNAAAVGPNQSENIWLDRDRFFHKGTNGQWRDVLVTDEDRQRYAARIAELTDAAFSDWLHQGAL